jgi:PilZ domain
MWVSWKIDERRITSRVLNLSASGALIDSQEFVPVGTQLELLFATKEGEIKLQAVTRNFQPSKGLGVEFVGMRARQLQLVLKLVKRLFTLRTSDAPK